MFRGDWEQGRISYGRPGRTRPKFIILVGDVMVLAAIVWGRVAIRTICATISQHFKESLFMMETKCKLKYFDTEMVRSLTKLRLRYSAIETSFYFSNFYNVFEWRRMVRWKYPCTTQKYDDFRASWTYRSIYYYDYNGTSFLSRRICWYFWKRL